MKMTGLQMAVLVGHIRAHGGPDRMRHRFPPSQQ
jgi:hypothetical protein